MPRIRAPTFGKRATASDHLQSNLTEGAGSDQAKTSSGTDSTPFHSVLQVQSVMTAVPLNPQVHPPLFRPPLTRLFRPASRKMVGPLLQVKKVSRAMMLHLLALVHRCQVQLQRKMMQ